MNLIDTNAVSDVLERGSALREDYFLVPDIVEEVEMAQIIHGRRIPSKLHDLSRHPLFNERIYLHHYRNVLNKYGGRFYGMRDFGDMSILATLRMLMDVFDEQQRTQLFPVTEEVVVFTDDGRLARRINREFAGEDVRVAARSGVI